ncbi:hypothetical protein HED22_15980 [Thalassospira sp. HF15]|uniref:hypothetical protein n=1 Tax=Thalassospira sp. HF15 TaxID=2722755 RepID=UPI00142F8632|nr:hypothetical protein [Thalassospira sp. HF15]NIY77152.1 hypothetical protein [Thalassospira sp. HF15]
MSKYAEVINDIMKRPLPDSFSSGAVGFEIFDTPEDNSKKEAQETQYSEIVRYVRTTNSPVELTALLKKAL